MLLNIRVVPRSSKNEISQMADGSYKIKLTTAPVDGKANEALIALLSKEFGVAKSGIRVVKGERGRNKVIEIREWSKE